MRELATDHRRRPVLYGAALVFLLCATVFGVSGCTNSDGPASPSPSVNLGKFLIVPTRPTQQPRTGYQKGYQNQYVHPQVSDYPPYIPPRPVDPCAGAASGPGGSCSVEQYND
jgi:hypothetical protein